MSILFWLLLVTPGPTQQPTYKLAGLSSAPLVDVSRPFKVVFTRHRTRLIEGVEPSQEHEHQVFSQEDLLVDQTDRLSSCLRRYSRAELERSGHKTSYDHVGKYVLFRREREVWRPNCYILVDGQRKDLAINLSPLKTDARSLEIHRRMWPLLRASFPTQPVPVGFKWDGNVLLLADELQSLTGLDKDNTDFQLTLIEVSETSWTLSFSGRLSIKAVGTGPIMVWAGEVKGKLVLARGPYRELLRELTLKETVSLTRSGQTITGTGTLTLKREMKDLPQ